MHAIIRTHHLNFHVRFWPISAFMSKTIQSKSNLTLCTFSDTCVWSIYIVSNCNSDPESCFTQYRQRRLSLSSSLPWRELKHGVRSLGDFPRGWNCNRTKVFALADIFSKLPWAIAKIHIKQGSPGWSRNWIQPKQGCCGLLE